VSLVLDEVRFRSRPAELTATKSNGAPETAMTQPTQLYVAMYHYIRDFSRTRFPRIKGMPLDHFRQQLRCLSDDFEMATLESATAFLSAEYQPKRNLCLMTFDDGLKEHYADVTPLLAECGIQGLFFVISACLEDQVVAAVHMNHFLMADLGFERYRDLFNTAADDVGEVRHREAHANAALARRTYPLDTADVAEFKYMFNFVMPAVRRDSIIKALFENHFGDQASFAKDLYLSWDDARRMQRAGMTVGGHTHQHRPLSTLSETEMKEDLSRCKTLMDENLGAHRLKPFSYPYGKSDSFNHQTVENLHQLGFCCSFTTETGDNICGTDLFAINRIDGHHHPALHRPQQSHPVRSSASA
jgi:peptidoglycan/xylan/chitin deacetylase (PgdA/CDA1 family)